MIKKIKLQNWKSHLDSEFEFSKGVNGLIGIMGSGKTSVMDAISFALFGTCPNLKAKKITLNDLIMKKPQQKTKATVELEFEINGKNYLVKRVIELDKGTVEAEIRENGKLLNVNSKNVTAEVERILQMDYELFSKAVYSEQNSLDYFLTIPKGQRMEKIDKMLKLDRFEIAREGAVGIENKIKVRKREKEKIYSELTKEDVKKKIVEILAEIEEINEEISLLKHRLELIREEKKELSEKISEIEGKEEKLNSLEKDLKGIEIGLKETNENIEKIKERIKGKDLNELSKEYEKLGNEIKNLENSLEEKNKILREKTDELSSIETKISIIKEEIPKISLKISEKEKDYLEFEELKKELKEPENVLKERKEEIEQLKKSLYDFEAKRREILRVLNELERVKDKCPVCESTISTEKRENLINERKEKIKALEKEIEEKKGILEEKIKGLGKIEERVKRFGILEEKIKGLEELKKDLEKMKNNLELFQNKSPSLKEEIENFKNLKEKMEKELMEKKVEADRIKTVLNEIGDLKILKKKKEEYENKKEEILKEKEKLEKELEEVKISELRLSLQEKIKKETEVLTKINNSNQIIEEKGKRLEELKEKDKILENYKNEIKNYEKVIEEISNFIKALKITQDQLREEFLKTVNYIMNKIWEELYPYKDFPEIRLTIDGDYVLQLKEMGKWIPVEGIVSGGERSLACLALRIAFSLAFIPNLRWLILDEPTHNLDTIAITHFSNILKEKINQFVDQVFIITHEERISDAITGNLYKLERNKEINEPTRIAEI